MIPNAARLVTFAELKILEDTDPDGPGYKNVHERHDGTFEAVVFKKRVSPHCTFPSEAARYQIAWWKESYGADWPGVFRGIQGRGWRIVTEPDGCRMVVSVVRTPGLPTFHPPGQWYLTNHGKRIVATANRRRTPDFLTRDEAKRALESWTWDVWGIFEPLSSYAIRSIALPATHDADGNRVTGTRCLVG